MTDYKSMTDQELIELSLFGDDRAFSELVLRHEKVVLGTTMKVTGNTYSAQDASQDAFISAWIKLNTLSDPGKFRPWICRIARNSARNLVDHYRATAADISLDTSLLVEDEIPDAALDNIEKGELREMVRSLDEKIREAVVLHYFEGYSVSEIAERLGQPVGTVKWRLSEGRKILRKGYGAMEEYNENEEMVRRVMRQVEKLKLWQLKEDKSGFADEYREVLKNVNDLDESDQKDSALAEVLLMGYRWLDNIPRKSALDRIKALAEKVGTQELMQGVADAECMLVYDSVDFSDVRFDKLESSECDRIIYGRVADELKKLIPYYAHGGYLLAECRILMNVGEQYAYIRDYAAAKECLDEIAAKAPKGCKLYVEAVNLLDMYDKFAEEDDEGAFYSAYCFEMRQINNKLCFWGGDTGNVSIRTIGFTDAYYNLLIRYPFSNYLYDGIIYDPAMKPGQEAVCSDKKVGVTMVSDDAEVEVPAGRFSGCRHYVVKRSYLYKSDTALTDVYYHPNVGPVKTVYTNQPASGEYPRCRNEVVLCSYNAAFDGLVPRAGSRWDYQVICGDPVYCHPEEFSFPRYCVENGRDYFKEFSIQIVSSDAEKATAVLRTHADTDRFDDTWEGDVYRMNYILTRSLCTHKKPDLGMIDAALSRDITRRQRTHLKLARRTLERIAATCESYPENRDRVYDCQWDRFDVFEIKDRGGCVTMERVDPAYQLSCLPFRAHIEGEKIKFSEFIDILSDSTGYLWNDKWVPGYSEKYTRDVYGLKDRDLNFHFVRRGETVTVPAGTFENCVHIQFDMRDLGGTEMAYRGGWQDYWFAPGVGIVQYFRLLGNTYDCYWQLTEYSGTGDGYFPSGDGLFRRYEPKNLRNGFRSSLEITFVCEDGRTFMFADGEGSQLHEEHITKDLATHDEYRAVREHDPRRNKYLALKQATADLLAGWDPYGFASEGNEKEYEKAAETITGVAIWGVYDPAEKKDVRAGSVEKLEENIKNILVSPSGKLDGEKLRALSKMLFEQANKDLEKDEEWKDYLRRIDDRLISSEFDALLKKAKEMIGELDGHENGQIVVVDTVKRNIHAAVIPDASSKETIAERSLINDLSEQNDAAILRMLCIRKDGTVCIPSQAIRDMLIEANGANENTVILVEKENGHGILRLGDL